MKDSSSEYPQLVMLPSSVLDKLQDTQDQILESLDRLRIKNSEEEYITAQEFMDRVKISRATFDEKRLNNEIKVIKKGRKLYLNAGSVKKYFEG